MPPAFTARLTIEHWNCKLSILFDKTYRPILWIMAALVAWGSLHALGAYLFGHDYRKPLIIYGCLLAFLGTWAALLTIRSRRLAKEQWQSYESKSADATDSSHG